MDNRAHRFRCDFSVGDAIGNMILWLILIVVTLGLAAFVFPYYLPKAIILKTTVIGHDGSEVGRLKCDLTLGSMIGNAFIWIILTIITLGLAYFVYIYRVLRVVLMETKIEYNIPVR
ncbi:DUF6693 family protein [uncultured Ruegeria sp.]|uniref:DUF6693 family protein n=1 Tax=uncultured Ruegeria sp. TaxID=259304 RepID=UPI00260EFAFF|nr:DUF6693 family protein [uncultured Ruegeria sp.]